MFPSQNVFLKFLTIWNFMSKMWKTQERRPFQADKRWINNSKTRFSRRKFLFLSPSPKMSNLSYDVFNTKSNVSSFIRRDSVYNVQSFEKICSSDEARNNFCEKTCVHWLDTWNRSVAPFKNKTRNGNKRWNFQVKESAKKSPDFSFAVSVKCFFARCLKNFWIEVLWITHCFVMDLAFLQLSSGTTQSLPLNAWKTHSASNWQLLGGGYDGDRCQSQFESFFLHFPKIWI